MHTRGCLWASESLSFLPPPFLPPPPPPSLPPCQKFEANELQLSISFAPGRSVLCNKVKLTSAAPLLLPLIAALASADAPPLTLGDFIGHEVSTISGIMRAC